MKITGLKRRKNNKNVTSKVSSEEKAIGEKMLLLSIEMKANKSELSARLLNLTLLVRDSISSWQQDRWR